MTVNAAGVLDQVTLTPAARKLEADALAALIVATAREAQQLASARMAEVMAGYLGEGAALAQITQHLPGGGRAMTTPSFTVDPSRLRCPRGQRLPATPTSSPPSARGCPTRCGEQSLGSFAQFLTAGLGGAMTATLDAFGARGVHCGQGGRRDAAGGRPVPAHRRATTPPDWPTSTRACGRASDDHDTARHETERAPDVARINALLAELRIARRRRRQQGMAVGRAGRRARRLARHVRLDRQHRCPRLDSAGVGLPHPDDLVPGGAARPAARRSGLGLVGCGTTSTGAGQDAAAVAEDYQSSAGRRDQRVVRPGRVGLPEDRHRTGRRDPLDRRDLAHLGQGDDRRR